MRFAPDFEDIFVALNVEIGGAGDDCERVRLLRVAGVLEEIRLGIGIERDGGTVDRLARFDVFCRLFRRTPLGFASDRKKRAPTEAFSDVNFLLAFETKILRYFKESARLLAVSVCRALEKKVKSDDFIRVATAFSRFSRRKSRSLLDARRRRRYNKFYSQIFEITTKNAGLGIFERDKF